MDRERRRKRRLRKFAPPFPGVIIDEWANITPADWVRLASRFADPEKLKDLERRSEEWRTQNPDEPKTDR